MGSPPDRPDPAARAARRASNALARAARIDTVCRRLEQRVALVAPEFASILRETVARQRESERRLRAVAVLHQRHAQRLARLGPPAPAEAGGASPFMVALAEQLDRVSAGLALLDARGTPLSTAASDATARAAVDLELSLGEGPAHDVVGGRRGTGARPLIAGDPAGRWPLYGPALAPLGVGAVIAARIGPDGCCLGALLAFHPSPIPGSDLVDRVHDLAISLGPDGDGPEPLGPDSVDPLTVLTEEAELHHCVHQAAGMLSVHLTVAVADAYAVLRARAFAEGVTLDVLAAQVVAGRCDLGSD